MSSIRTDFDTLSSLVAYATSRDEGNSKAWFRKDTMRWHGTKLGDGPYRGADGRSYFTTRDSTGFGPDAGKAWSVRVYDPQTNDVSTVSFISYGSKEKARNAAKFNAGMKAKG